MTDGSSVALARCRNLPGFVDLLLTRGADMQKPRVKAGRMSLINI